MNSVEHVHTLWDVFEARGIPALLEHVHEDFEIHGPPELPGAEDIHGVEAVLDWVEDLRVEGVRFEPVRHRFSAVGDRVVVSGRLRVVTRGALTDSPAFYVYRLRDDRVARVDAYDSLGEALTAR